MAAWVTRRAGGRPHIRARRSLGTQAPPTRVARTTPTQAQVNLLVGNPEAFLRQYALKWAGQGPAAQGVITAALCDGSGESQARIQTGTKFRGLQHVKENVETLILRDNHFPHWQIAQPGTITFPAAWSGYVAGGAANAVLPNAGGPDIMLTPEFTGCAAVCHTNADGSADFSHYNLLKANGKETLDAAQMRAHADGTYADGYILMTKESQRGYAKVATNGVRSTVVGVRRLGRWEFWVQHRESKPVGTSGTTIQIRAVQQLH